MIKNILSTLILSLLILSKVQAQSLEIYIHSALKNSPLLYDYNNQLQARKVRQFADNCLSVDAKIVE